MHQAMIMAGEDRCRIREDSERSNQREIYISHNRSFPNGKHRPQHAQITQARLQRGNEDPMKPNTQIPGTEIRRALNQNGNLELISQIK